MLTIKLQRGGQTGLQQRVFSCTEYSRQAETPTVIELTIKTEEGDVVVYIGPELPLVYDEDNLYDVAYIENGAGKTIDKIGAPR